MSTRVSCRLFLVNPSYSQPKSSFRPGAGYAFQRVRTASTMSNSNTKDELDSQTMTLPDGRTLGYSEYGHPNGYPLVYLHGYPSSRFEGSVINGLARKR